jgi:monoamine oxidase
MSVYGLMAYGKIASCPPRHPLKLKRNFYNLPSLHNGCANNAATMASLCLLFLLIASSQDPQWRKLDKVSFAQWLTQQGFTDSSLRWYLDYCCRDDFGLNSPFISAWAGLHYFASRTGQGRNIAPQSEAVLTWPQGLQYLAQKMLPKTAQQQQGFALHINEHQQGVDVLYSTDIGRNAFTLQAKRVICAMPLHVTARLFPQIKDYGFEPQHIPPHAPWLVSNVYLDRFPQEATTAP